MSLFLILQVIFLLASFWIKCIYATLCILMTPSLAFDLMSDDYADWCLLGSWIYVHNYEWKATFSVLSPSLPSRKCIFTNCRFSSATCRGSCEYVIMNATEIKREIIFDGSEKVSFSISFCMQRAFAIFLHLIILTLCIIKLLNLCFA